MILLKQISLLKINFKVKLQLIKPTTTEKSQLQNRINTSDHGLITMEDYFYYKNLIDISNNNPIKWKIIFQKL